MKDLMNKITLGDSLELLDRIEDKSIDLVLTDIPYDGVNEAAKNEGGLRSLNVGVADEVTFSLSDLITKLIRVCRGSIYIFCGQTQVSEIISLLKVNGCSTRFLVWEKTNPSPMNGETIWLSGIECCAYGKFSGATFNAHCKNTVLKYPICREADRFHKTQKPLSLWSYLMEVSSNAGDLVLDPFSGSGVTAVAAV